MQEDLRYWLAEVCRERRTAAGLARSVVAAQFNGTDERVKNFERVRGLWSPHTGTIVEAYAVALDADPADLWAEALNRWRASQPAASPDSQRKQDRLMGRVEDLRVEAREGSTRSPAKPQRAKRQA